MKSFTVTTALLLSCFCWSTKSDTVTVKSGEDVDLSCRNISSKPVPAFWSRLLEGGNYSCIASMNRISEGLKFCDKITDDRFKMSSNESHVILKIRGVEMSDYGFYFCGLAAFGNFEIDVVHLKVTGSDSWSDGDTGSKCESNPTWWMSVILGGACVLLLTIIVGFAVKLKRLQTEQNREEHAPRENQASENLNYAAVNFKQKQRRTRRADSTEPSVLYAATR